MLVHAVIQARSSSSRLPGKVLRPLGDRSVLSWVVRAAERADGIAQVIVATSTDEDDDVVAEEALRLGARVVRGDLDDVLSRFVLALDLHPCDAIVRLTADCPLLDPSLIAQVISLWRSSPTTDYVATTLHRTLPRGLDVELIRADSLRTLALTATGHHRSHVTSAAYHDDSVMSRLGLVVAPSAADLRVTLDTPEDAIALAAIVAALGEGPYEWRRVVGLLRARPELTALNAGVRQKPLEEG